MANASSHDQQSSNPGQAPPNAGARPDDAPENHAKRTEQRAIDDQGGGTGLPAEARESPIGTPIGGSAAGSGGVGGGATGQTREGDPG